MLKETVPMIETITRLLDPYERKARLAPALLVLVPMLAILWAIYGDKVGIKSGLAALLAACGVLFWMAKIARNAGARLQEGLFARWGGMPSTQLLRHRDATIDPITKDRYHKVLSKGIGKELPSEAAEHADPQAADMVYRSGIKWLIEQTRDPRRYAHLLKENIAYGFHRNMLGLRPIAICKAALCLGASIIWIGGTFISLPGDYSSKLSGITFEQAAAFIVSLTALLLWIFGVTESGVRAAAFAYGERLLQACEGMSKPARTRASRTENAGKNES